MNDPAADAAPVRQLTYTGRLGRLFGLYIANVALNIVTLGIYRFWAKTKLRQFFHDHVFFMDEPFAYLGTGKELFVSSLKFIIQAVLPLVLLVILAEMLLPEPMKPLLWTAEVLLIGCVYLYARLSGLRYRANRMSWRSIRFALKVERAAYLKLLVKNVVLNIVTLGLYRPRGDAALLGLFINNLYFGDLRFAYRGDLKDLQKNYIVYWLLFLPTFGCSMFWYRARLYRHIAKYTALGVMEFRYNVSGGKIFGLLLGNIGITAVSFGLLRPMAMQRSMKFFATNLKLRGAPDFAQIQKAGKEPDGGGAADYLGADEDFGFG